MSGVHTPVGPPVPRAHHPIPLGDPSSRREEQGEGEVGGRLGEDTRGVADRNAPGSGRGDVDVVDAHRHGGDDAQRRGGLEKRPIDAVGEQTQEPFGLTDPRAQRLRCRRTVLGHHLELDSRGQLVEGSPRQRLGRDDPGHDGDAAVLSAAAS